MGRIDDYMINVLKIPGIVLMENASRAVVDYIMQKFCPRSGAYETRVIIFCGCGNNGGDGFAVARGLKAQGFDVHAVLVGDENSVTGDARTNMEFFMALGERLFLANSPEELQQAAAAAGDAEIVVDALFGTGLTREIGGLYREAVSVINGMNAYKVSVDKPNAKFPYTFTQHGVRLIHTTSRPKTNGQFSASHVSVGSAISTNALSFTASRRVLLARADYGRCITQYSQISS
jgi:hydroxyethylthiazole kinase-like uncharacterized protein yjeF